MGPLHDFDINSQAIKTGDRPSIPAHPSPLIHPVYLPPPPPPPPPAPSAPFIGVPGTPLCTPLPVCTPRFTRPVLHQKIEDRGVLFWVPPLFEAPPRRSPQLPCGMASLKHHIGVPYVGQRRRNAGTPRGACPAGAKSGRRDLL